MVDFGMAPMDAIKSATSRPAIMLDRQGDLGVIAAGAYADVIALSENPLQNIKAMEKVEFCDERRKSF